MAAPPGRWLVTLGALSLGLSVALVACKPDEAPSPPKPDVLLVTFDTTRYDAIDYGATNRGAIRGPVAGISSATPTSAGLAARGVRFERAYSPAPVTLPAHTTLLTGLDPLSHGVRNNCTYKVDSSLVTLAERMQASGYHTGAAIGGFPLISRFGLAQGFSVFDEEGVDQGDVTRGIMGERSATAVTDAALSVAAQLAAPRFLWIHYFDPHGPYEPPEPFLSQFEGNPYQGEVAYADSQLGRLIEGLPKNADGRLVVLTADHGESLEAHGEPTHGVFLHDATTRVPLIMSWPGHLPQGRVVDRVARLMDVAPTILDLLGLSVSKSIQGKSLRLLWEGSSQGDLPGKTRPGEDPPGRDRPAYAESWYSKENLGMTPLSSLLVDGLRLVRSGRERLFDLAADPGETRDVGKDRQQDVVRLSRALDEYTRAHRSALGRSGPEALDPDARAQLAALGYVWFAQGADGTDPSRLPDPYDHTELIRLASLIPTGREALEKAYQELSRMKGTLPDSHVVWEQLIRVGSTLQLPGVLADLQEAVTRFPNHTPYRAALARDLALEGRMAEATVHLDRVLEQIAAIRAEGQIPVRPTEEQAGVAALLLDRWQEADTLFRAVDLPGTPRTPLRLERARLFHSRELWGDAIRDYRAYLKEYPDDVSALRNLSYAMAGSGQAEEALHIMDSCLKKSPAQPELWLMRAKLLLGLERQEEAVASCRGHLKHGGEDPRCRRLVAEGGTRTSVPQGPPKMF